VSDPFDLDRYVEAQDRHDTYATALGELRRGHKRSHWMWFVFPQLVGLGHSELAHHYGIRGSAEARAYLEHPVLGDRLRECVRVLTGLDATDAVDIFGSVDAVKLRSSLTLFAMVAPEEPLFDRALDQYFGGSRDELTTTRLSSSS
jgi:uncharacterized protein (DUF1810 family)